MDIKKFLWMMGGLSHRGGAIVRFWAAWADAAGVNQTLLTGTGPVTTDHTSAIYALGSDGEYDAYTTDDPVWQYDADGDYLVAQDAGTNDQIQSNDQTNVEWTATNVTVAQDESGFAESKDACTLTATAANGTVIANAITAASGEHAAKWYIKRKTGTGNIDLTLDNGTGWTTVTLTSDFDLFAIDQAALTNPQIGIRIVASGDAVIVGNAECHLTSTVEKVKSLGPIFTTSGSATSSELHNVYPAANHSNTEGPLYIEFENTGDDVVLLEAGTDEFLKIEDGTDGVTYSEEITNGDFATGDLTGWTQNQNWSVVDNKAICNATGIRDFIYQGAFSSLYISGKTFVISYDIEITTGSLLVEVGAEVYINGVITASIPETTSGYKEYVLSFTGDGITSNRPLIGSGTSDTVASIDNISIREVDGKYLKLTDGTSQLQMKLT